MQDNIQESKVTKTLGKVAGKTSKVIKHTSAFAAGSAAGHVAAPFIVPSVYSAYKGVKGIQRGRRETEKILHPQSKN